MHRRVLGFCLDIEFGLHISQIYAVPPPVPFPQHNDDDISDETLAAILRTTPYNFESRRESW